MTQTIREKKIVFYDSTTGGFVNITFEEDSLRNESWYQTTTVKKFEDADLYDSKKEAERLMAKVGLTGTQYQLNTVQVVTKKTLLA